MTHFLAAWAAAGAAGLDRRDAALVAAAGTLPDADGIGIVADLLTRGGERPSEWWGVFHHTFGHGVLFAILAAAVVAAFAHRRRRAALLAFAVVHLHLLGDLVGARGPEGEHWAIPYLWPLPNSPLLVWDGQWALNAWPNFAITVALIAGTILLARRDGFSPVGILSRRADEAFVAALRRRFGDPSGG
ncbi:metal-dependent hydrolase [Candidatus Deferrimicrobium sp.]|uniref:metal-dependent hydrolase n=1 Tax=Candidatus Deferrimicrobium sp. TaxID=3060586 RepID=UPI002722B1AE|nr:metal-dependent hydrolase [Candidatus Deferrimicrobium sp.]MDO8738409.1 metal-dependent hydrolase [Candidatus Deferrimicrobium sp.]